MYDPLGKWMAEEFMLVGLTHKGAFLVILDLLGRQTYKEVFDDSDLLGKFFPFVTHDGVGWHFGPIGKSLMIWIHLGKSLLLVTH